jgi:vacuolar-type H+-ATPase subunit E/Vma4
MAIEDIFRALEEQAESEVQEILRVAKAQAKSIESEAKEEAERITDSRVSAAEAVVRAKAGKSVNAARLEAKRALAAVREAAVDSVFATAAERLATMRGTPAYAAVFEALVSEAAAGIEDECVMLVAPEDAALAAKVAKGLGTPCTVDATLDTIGGVSLTYDGGRIVRQNTFESRLAKVRGLAAATVAETLAS